MATIIYADDNKALVTVELQAYEVTVVPDLEGEVKGVTLLDGTVLLFGVAMQHLGIQVNQRATEILADGMDNDCDIGFIRGDVLMYHITDPLSRMRKKD